MKKVKITSFSYFYIPENKEEWIDFCNSKKLCGDRCNEEECIFGKECARHDCKVGPAVKTPEAFKNFIEDIERRII